MYIEPSQTQYKVSERFEPSNAYSASSFSRRSLPGLGVAQGILSRMPQKKRAFYSWPFSLPCPVAATPLLVGPHVEASSSKIQHGVSRNICVAGCNFGRCGTNTKSVRPTRKALSTLNLLKSPSHIRLISRYETGHRTS